MNFNKKIIPLVLATTVSQSCIPTAAFAENNIQPKEAAYGYYVDVWNKNTTSNMDPNINPAIGVLSGFSNIWEPGSSWDNGNILNTDVHEHNINTVIAMTKNNATNTEVEINTKNSSRTTVAAVELNTENITTGAGATINTIKDFTTGNARQVYFDDRRDQNYSMIDGLGKYTDRFIKLTNAGTTIKDVPADATKLLYDDKKNSNGKWADDDSELGNMVKLINTLRNSAASTTPSKNYYQYMRPFRWSTDVKILPTLLPAKKSDAQAGSDGGFPSGHTNAAYVSAIGLAYAAPERFQEILTRASELGNNRIKAGMHSPLDVMGGRTTATAVAAAALCYKDNTDLKAAAYNEAHTKLFTHEGTSKDRFSDYKENKKNYIKRLTYGFEQIGPTNKPMIVPKGAEVLLETRLPYLDANQRREVLYTTGIESGYPVLDDTEGWGRLNLFAAADGYGNFNNIVTVNMDASKGGFNAADSWRNDISGTGALVKEGTGTLKLGGDNTYSGGTQIHQGILQADSPTAFGTGSVTNDGGILVENVSGEIALNKDYKQSENSTLELSIGSKDDVLKVNDNAVFSGKLKLDFTDNYIPENNMTIITFNNSNNSRFSTLETTGLPSGYSINLAYSNNSVMLIVEKVNNSNNSSSSRSSSHHSSSSTSSNTNLSQSVYTANNGNNTTTEIKTGWEQKDGIWYNFSSMGTANTGWFRDTDNKWYYLSESGAMQKGWFKDKDGAWYYLGESGAMVTGWFKDQNDKWYYLNESGAMLTGWFKDTDDTWYYLNESGAMEHDTYINGYYLDSTGACANN